MAGRPPTPLPRRSLDRRILALALPAAGSTLVHVVHRAVDMAWVRDLGTEALASLTISTVSVWMLAAVGWLVAMGLTALVARYAGARRPEGARYVAGQGLRWAAAVGGAVAAGGWFAAPLLFIATDAAPHVREAGLLYARIYWTAAPFVLVHLASDAIFRAHGDTRTPFLIAVTALLLNVVLDPLLIWGWGPVPALGVPGAAVATAIASLAGMGLSLAALRARRLAARARPDDDVLRLDPRTRLGRPGLLGFDLAVFRRVARVGSPTLAANLLFNLILLEMLRVAQAAGGPAAQAGLGVGHTGEGVAYVICLGWAAAAASLVGRRLGAGHPRAAERAAWRAAFQCAAICLVWGLVLFFLDEEVAGLWAEEPGARAHAASYFRIVAFCLVPQAVEVVLDGAFGGAGMTIPPMVVAITLSTARIPLAWWAAFDLGWGVDGIWVVIAVTAALRGFAIAAWFARGTWKTRTV